jgi:hypothetical protein
MSQTVNREEWEILKGLDKALRNPGAHQAIETIAGRVAQRLNADPDATLAWEPVPLETYGPVVPQMIRSSWVFVLRRRTTSGAERHPNSHQRVMSYRGRADMQTWENGAWRSNVLVEDSSAPLDQRWLSIPVNVWHKPVMGESDWVVVSFHTATDAELIEERGDPEQIHHARQETYLSRSDSGFLGAR